MAKRRKKQPPVGLYKPEWATAPDPERALRGHLARLERSCREISAECGWRIPKPGEVVSADPQSVRGHVLSTLAAVRGARDALDRGDLARAALAAVAGTEHHGIAITVRAWAADRHRGRSTRRQARSVAGEGGRARALKTAAVNAQIVASARQLRDAIARQNGGTNPNIATVAREMIARRADPKNRNATTIARLIAPALRG